MKKTSIKKILYLVLICFGSWYKLQAQDIELANEYFTQGEFLKARDMYEKLSGSSSYLRVIHTNYLATLLQLKDYQTAEKLLKRQIKLNSDNPLYFVEYGVVFEKQNKIKEAEKEWTKVISNFKTEEQQVNMAFSAFMKYEKYDWVEKFLFAARKSAQNPTAYANFFADLYSQTGKKESMLKEYTRLAQNDFGQLEYVKNMLQDEFSEEKSLKQLEQFLLTEVQREPNDKIYNELVLWLYMQEKTFYKAFIQAKAMDKRFKLAGSQLMEVAMVSYENKDYKNASKMFEYLLEQYPQGNSYIIARRFLIRCKEAIIKATYPIETEKVKSLAKDYQILLQESGKNQSTLEIMEDMGLLYGLYLNQKDTAIIILNEAAELGKTNVKFLAHCKISLGDMYLLKNEPWEATLLYSQAEKLQKDSPFGYEAKLKNAKLNYYKGDFELAQAHLDILKKATSREIANDAMDLSVLIQDNTGLDSTEKAMREYARIDLLIVQNKIEEATKDLDKMLLNYPNHSLTDEIYWLKADIYLKTGQNEKAIIMLEKILNDYKQDILSDDAYFLLGKIYEERLNDKPKAMEIYQNHLKKYPGSIYIAEARKRFRALRGDGNN
jgi:tetratricopeptide (TPR) repeat protein